MNRTSADFLKDGYDGDAPQAFSWKDQPVGTKIVGTIIKEPTTIMRPAVDKDKPDVEALPIQLDVDGTEEGRRTLWVQAGYLHGAIKAACKEAEVDGIAEGGKLGVELIEKRDVGKPSKANIFKAQYAPPAAKTVNVGDIFG